MTNALITVIGIMVVVLLVMYVLYKHVAKQNGDLKEMCEAYKATASRYEQELTIVQEHEKTLAKELARIRHISLADVLNELQNG